MKRRMVTMLAVLLTFSLLCGIVGCGSSDDTSDKDPTVSEAQKEQEELEKIRQALESDDDIIIEDDEISGDEALEDDEDKDDNQEDLSAEEETPQVETIKWGVVRKQYQQIESEAASAIGELDTVDGTFVLRQVESIYSKVDYLEEGITSGTDNLARDAYLAACKLEYLGVKGDDVSDSIPVKLGIAAKEMIKLCYGEGDGDFEKLQKSVKAYIEMIYDYDQDDWDEFKSHF